MLDLVNLLYMYGNCLFLATYCHIYLYINTHQRSEIFGDLLFWWHAPAPARARLQGRNVGSNGYYMVLSWAHVDIYSTYVEFGNYCLFKTAGGHSDYVGGLYQAYIWHHPFYWRQMLHYQGTGFLYWFLHIDDDPCLAKEYLSTIGLNVQADQIYWTWTRVRLKCVFVDQIAY